MKRTELVTLVAFAAPILAGCATIRTACYSNIYLDDRYTIQGTYAGSEEVTDSCYQFVSSSDGRVIRIDHRKGGQLTRDPFFGVERIVITYADGMEKRISFTTGHGLPTPNANGVYAIRLSYDKNRNPVEWRNLRANDQLQEDSESGVAMVRWEYDTRGDMVEQRYFGANAQPKEDKHRGVAIIRWTYDEAGRTIEEGYFGPDGRLTEDKVRGVAIVRWKYDMRGSTVEQRYFGADAQPEADRHRGVAIIRWKYDEAGNPIEERYYDLAGRLTEDRVRGGAIVRWEYDLRRGTLRTFMFDRYEIPIK